MTLSRGDVAERLGLGEEYAAWLAHLDALGPVPDVVALSLDQTEAELRRLGFAADDARDVIDTHGAIHADPSLRWLFDRAVHGMRLEVGLLDGSRRTPTLPAALGAPGRLFWVHVYLAALPAIREWHAARGVTETISEDTLSDFGRHVALYRRRTGLPGLDTQWWLSLHFRDALFALGRLQFNPFSLCTGPAGPLFWYPEAPNPALRCGQPALGVHIPESGPLTPSAVDAALGQAYHFFRETFPAQASNVAVCTSWLLDEQLADYLAADSNIVRFQRRFTLLPGSKEADASPFHFVFGTSPAAAPTLQPRTTLERALLGHLADGKHWALRTGWLQLGP
jgi:hypothetical protein